MGGCDDSGQLYGEAEFAKVIPRKTRRKARNTRKPFDFSEVLGARRRSLSTDDWLDLTRGWLEDNLAKAGNPNIKRIVCLGLGSFAAGGPTDDTTPDSRRKSQSQLVLMSDVLVPSLAEATTSRQLVVEVFDPAISDEDRTYLKKAGYTVLDEEPPLRAQDPTLFYMPHAPRSLYEKLLAANAPDLSPVFVLGNSFARYRDDPREGACMAIPTITRYCPLMCEVTLPVPKKVEGEIGRDVFNETSLHWLRSPTITDDTKTGTDQLADRVDALSV